MVVFLGIADLGINIPVLIGQILSFTFLLIVLRLFVYKPVVTMLDERKARIEEGLNAAERGREAGEEASKAAAAQLDEARREGQQVVANAQQVSQRIQEEARTQAQQQQEAMLERARAEIQQERDAAIAELRQEFADLTISAAEKVIGQSLDRQAHQRLIDEAIQESSFREN